jgi:hypothetical protein
MYIFLMFVFLVSLNLFIYNKAKQNRSNWIKSSLLVMFLFTPIVTIVSGYSIAINEGDGIAGGAGGFAFGIVTFINGLLLLVKGFITRKAVELDK